MRVTEEWFLSRENNRWLGRNGLLKRYALSVQVKMAAGAFGRRKIPLISHVRNNRWRVGGVSGGAYNGDK